MYKDGITANDLRKYIAEKFPDYLLISRKENNHEARLINRKTGVVTVSAGSNKLLLEKLESPDVMSRLLKPQPSLGLVVQTIDVSRKTEAEKLEAMVNNAVMELREWLECDMDVRLVEDSAGKYRFMVNGKFIVQGRKM